jgi:endonuclease I
MRSRAWTAFAAIFLSVAGTLIPMSGLAITVATFVSQNDQALQATELRQAINNVINAIQTNLRSVHNADGSTKTAEQLRLDRERADRILDIMKHVDHQQLAAMIMDANDRQPNVELEKVIIAYIFQELQQTPGKPASPK